MFHLNPPFINGVGKSVESESISTILHSMCVP